MNQISKDNIDRLGDNKEKFVQHIIDKELLPSEQVLSPWKRRLVKYNDLYMMVQQQRHYDGLAKIFVPEILRAVETVVGNLFKVIFGQNPWFEYEPQTDEEYPAAKAETLLVSHQMEENHFKLKTQDSLRQMAISGLTVRKVLWDFVQVTQKTKEVVLEEQTDGITGKKTKKRSVKDSAVVRTIKDHWTMEPVDLLSFHISDVTTPYHDIQKAEWIIEQTLVKKDWLRQKAKKGWIIDDDLDEIHEDDKAKDSGAERYKETRRQSSGYATVKNKTGVEILERWGMLKAKYVYTDTQRSELNLDEDDFVESVVVIANRKYILKLEPNPFWHNQKPYVSCPYVAKDNEFAGMGVAQIGESLQEELNDTRNQTMDNKSLVLMNMWLKSRSSGIRNQDLRVRPLGVIVTNDMDGLKPLAPPILSGVGVNIEGVIKEDLRQSVGASSNLQGIAQSGVNTATESTIVNRESFGRLFLTAQLYAELILKPVLNFAESLNYQYYEVAKVIQTIGAEGIGFQKVAPNDIVGHKNVVIRLSSDLDDNPGIKRQQLLQFLTIVQNMPPQVMQFHYKLLDRIYKSFFPNAKSLEDLYPAPPGEEQLLDPEQEFEIMKNGKPTPVHKGDDDQAHLKQHEADYDATKFALTEVSNKIQQNHIMDHYNQMSQKAQEQAQAVQQQALAAQEASHKGGKGGAPMGQIPGGTAFTQSAPTTQGDLHRNIGGA